MVQRIGLRTDGHEHLFDFVERVDERVTELAQCVQHAAELAQYVCTNAPYAVYR